LLVFALDGTASLRPYQAPVRPLAPRGMPGFQGKLTQQQANDIRAYLARRSFEDFGGN
jgi:hypothetical protein